MLKLYEQTQPKTNAHALHAIRSGKVQIRNRQHKKPQSQLAANEQNQGKEKNKLAYAPKPKIPPLPKREDPTKDSIYHQCVSRNNMVYFSVVLRDGIFEIDLSDSYTNVSSIYALSNKRSKPNLDFALLWHCRFRHISKKHIEKLLHDGLLNSPDLRDFEKCVPCMSEKMARKPYSHQVKRAKDQLGPIHTNNAEFLKNSLITQEASGSLEDLEIIQEDDTHPSIDTSLNYKEDDQEIDESQSDINPVCRYTRTHRLIDRLCLYVDAEEHELGDLGEPDLFELPPNDKTVGSKWLFKKKTYMDGAVHTYKARLVAKGYTQTSGIDYDETFFLVADIRAIRILIAIAAFYDYEIWQIDVRTAFLNGYLSEEIEVKLHIFLESRSTEIDHGDKLRLSKSQGASIPAELKRMKNVPYASVVGSIMYAVRCTRLDVAFAHNITSQFQQNPGDLHWTTIKNILKYLRNTKDMFLVYRGDIKQELRVSCYTDVGYLTDVDDCKAQTGYVFILNEGVVDWKSAKQSIFATSSVEVEYIAALMLLKKSFGLENSFLDLVLFPQLKNP
nr:hypothetical protein [Tanacetum cinerariifolium]